MQVQWKISAMIGLMALFSLTYSSPSNLPQITAIGSSIVLKAHQKQLVLQLRSNPTTGFSWYFDHSRAKWLTVTKHEWVAPKAKLVGAPGYERWTFNVDQASGVGVPRVATIVMRYARPWDIANSKPSRFYVVMNAGAQ